MQYHHILYTTDQSYFSHMLTSIYSLIRTNPDTPFMIHIIESNFTKKQIEYLETVISDYPKIFIKLYPEEKLKKLLQFYSLPKWRGTDIANARLFAHELIPEVEQLLYLDSDTIINGSLESLWRENNAPVAAVKDVVIPSHMKQHVINYYNSGVLYFDYSLWEKENCAQRLYDTFKKTKVPLLFPDQDLLNLAVRESIHCLSVDYNIMPSVYDAMRYPNLAKRIYKDSSFYSYQEIASSLQTPHIFHMLEYLNTRPWIENKTHPFNELYAENRFYWDSCFQKEKSNTLLANVPMLPFFNVLSKAVIPDELNYRMKEVIKRKIYKEIPKQ